MLSRLFVLSLTVLCVAATQSFAAGVCDFIDTTRAYNLKIDLVGVPGSDFTYTRKDGKLAKFWYKPITMLRGTSTVTVPGAYKVATDYDGDFPIPFISLHSQNSGKCEATYYNGLGYKFPAPPGAPVPPIPEVETHEQHGTADGYESLGQFVHAVVTFAK